MCLTHVHDARYREWCDYRFYDDFARKWRWNLFINLCKSNHVYFFEILIRIDKSLNHFNLRSRRTKVMGIKNARSGFKPVILRKKHIKSKNIELKQKRTKKCEKKQKILFDDWGLKITSTMLNTAFWHLVHVSSVWDQPFGLVILPFKVTYFEQRSSTIMIIWWMFKMLSNKLLIFIWDIDVC